VNALTSIANAETVYVQMYLDFTGNSLTTSQQNALNELNEAISTFTDLSGLPQLIKAFDAMVQQLPLDGHYPVNVNNQPLFDDIINDQSDITSASKIFPA